MRIRLSGEDRERLGVENEWLSYSFDRLMMSDAEALDAAGYDPDDFVEEMSGIPVLDETGAPVTIKVPGPDGALIEVDKRRRPVRATRAMVWLALRRADVKVPFTEFDFNIVGIEFAGDEAEQPAGKDEAPPPSAKSASGTRSRSRKSSGSGRGRSTS